MKHKILVVVVLVLFVFFAGEVSAAAPKAPTKLCLSTSLHVGSITIPILMALMVKSVGNMTMVDGTNNFYGINGFLFSEPGVSPPWNFPVYGTGHMMKDPGNVDWFHFTITGSTANTALVIFFTANLECYWDTVNKTGILWGNVTGTALGNPNDANATTISSPLVEAACGSLNIPEIPM